MAYGWQQESLAENFADRRGWDDEILGPLGTFVEAVRESRPQSRHVGQSDAYSTMRRGRRDAACSCRRRRFTELGVTETEIPDPAPIDKRARSLVGLTPDDEDDEGTLRPRGVAEQGRRYHQIVIAFFVALAIVVGVVEISVIIQVGQWIGFLNTVGLLLLVSLVGAWLVKRQGLGVMARIREQRSAGRIPATEAFDGALILVAGVLLVIPGFVTDASGCCCCSRRSVPSCVAS